MATVQELITDALIEIMAIAVGETPSSDDMQSGLRALNRLIDQWGAEKLNIYALGIAPFTVTGASTSGIYVIGSGLTGSYLNAIVAVNAPNYIDRVSVRNDALSPALEIPLRRLDFNEWEAIPMKSMTAPLPTCWFYAKNIRPAETGPMGDLNIWPIPTTALTGLIYYPSTQFEYNGTSIGTLLTSQVYLPPGYRRMIVKNLAVEMAPSFGRPISQDLESQAARSLSIIKRGNTRPRTLAFEAGAGIQSEGGRYDITSDRPI